MSDAYLYHVTLASRLPDIAESGLVPSWSSSFGGGYAGHAAGRLFFTDEDGVECWWGKIHDLTVHHHEGREIVDEAQIPVLLRVGIADAGNGLTWDDLEDDELGTRDCLGSLAYFTELEVDQADVEVWDGSSWRPVEDVATPEQIAAAYVTRMEEVEEDDGDAWVDVDLDLPSGWR